MQLKITIEMDNAAFEVSNANEAGRILNNLADEIMEHGELLHGDSFPLRDVNGNKVGQAVVSDR